MLAGHAVLASRGGIDPGDQLRYDKQGVAGPTHALWMGEGRGEGKRGVALPHGAGKCGVKLWTAYCKTCRSALPVRYASTPSVGCCTAPMPVFTRSSQSAWCYPAMRMMWSPQWKPRASTGYRCCPVGEVQGWQGKPSAKPSSSICRITCTRSLSSTPTNTGPG